MSNLTVNDVECFILNFKGYFYKIQVQFWKINKYFLLNFTKHIIAFTINIQIFNFLHLQSG